MFNSSKSEEPLCSRPSLSLHKRVREVMLAAFLYSFPHSQAEHDHTRSKHSKTFYDTDMMISRLLDVYVFAQ